MVTRTYGESVLLDPVPVVISVGFAVPRLPDSAFRTGVRIHGQLPQSPALSR